MSLRTGLALRTSPPALATSPRTSHPGHEILAAVKARRRRAAVAVLVATAVGVAMVGRLARSGRLSSTAPCQATVGVGAYPLDLEQAANATTVAAVGKRLGFVDHAVTIALAAALQESRLHNLSRGDLDSVGLFQQRPSQGWGTTSEILLPRYAATAFYQRLEAVPGWETMAVTDAAQAVQRSAAPDAYARWETEARVLAKALTGESATGLTCRFTRPGGPLLAGELTQAISLELGAPAAGVSVSAARGWTVASWLVGHARQYRIKAVAFNGWRWTPAQRSWHADPASIPRVEIAG